MKRFDDASARILEETIKRVSSLKSLQADAQLHIEMPLPDGVQKIEGKGRVWLERPNLSRVELTGGVGKVYVCDGLRTWRQFPGENQYMENPAEPDGKNAVNLPLHAAYSFFRPADLWPGPKEAVYKYIGQERFSGANCDVIERSQFAGKMTERFFIGPDRLVRRVVMALSVGKPQTIDSQLTRIRLNPRLDSKLFVFRPDPGAKPFILPGSRSDKKLAIGANTPELLLPTPYGKTLSLAGLSAGKRAVLVNFWYYNCGPCQEEMPVFEKLYRALKPQGFELLAVDNNDSADLLKKYISKNDLTFPIVMGKPDTFDQYGVSSYPTNYLVSPEGKILWQGTGYDPSGTGLGLKPALEKLGFTIPPGIFK
ncbi:MAG: redoxin domain-containing protein [Armatimonas sp.]